MSKQPVDRNAKEALSQMKMEVAEDLGMINVPIPAKNGETTSREYGFYGGPVGGEMTRRLVTMGERALLENAKASK